MTRKYSLPRLLLLILMLFLTLKSAALPPGQLSVQAAEKPSIRIGAFEMNGFFHREEDGSISGYGVDYLSKIAEKTGWTYEYVWASSWDECIELLRLGRVDLIAPAGKTESRSREFLFSGFSIGTECGALLTLSTNDKLVYEDFDAFQHLKTGCVDTLIFKDAFWTYAGMNGFYPDMVTYKDTRALMAALNAGEVEAVLVNLFHKTETTKVLAKYGAQPFYFMMSKGTPALKQTLDDALQQIKIEHTDFESELTQRYWPDFNNTPFTSGELEYIAQAPVLSIGCRSDSMPVSFTDEKTGEVTGITRDILEEISRVSGLKFAYVPLPYGEMTYDYLRDNGLSLIANVEYNQENSNAPGVRLSLPYLDSKKVFVMKAEDSFDTEAALKLAVSTGSPTLLQAIARAYPHFEVILCPTMEDCFKAVRRGEADALLQNQYVAAVYLSKPVYSDMMVVPVEGLEDKLCISPVLYQEKGISDSLLSDDRLISILNKSIRMIPEQDISKIIIRETSVNQYRYRFEDFLYQYRYFLVITAFFLLILILGLANTIRTRHRSMMIIAKNEAKLRHITNNINGGVVVLNASDKLQIAYANEGFLELLQCRREDLPQIKGQEYTAYVHPNDTQVLESLMTMDIQQERQVSIKLRIMRKDGSYLPTLFNGTITENEQGKREIYCVIMDISQQEQLLEAISLEQQKYGIMMENSGDILIELDCKTQTISISPLFQKKFGWKPVDDNMFHNTQDILRQIHVLPEDWDILEGCFNTVFHQSVNDDCVVRIQRKNGAFCWCRIHLYPMLDTQESLVYILGKILDIHQEVLERQELEHQSRTDALTGLLNKNAFFQEAGQYLQEEAQQRASEWNPGDDKKQIGRTALVFIDVDNFKQVNDRLGHMTGDQAIRETAKKLQIIFSNYDILSRFGGDEFCILLKEIPEETLKDKLSWAVEKLRAVYTENGQEVRCSASIGAAVCNGSPDLSQLLERADQALYRAKEHGKDQYIIYQEGM